MAPPHVELPPIPPLADELVAASDAAHQQLADALAQASRPARTLFAAVQQRRLLEAIAGVSPVLPEAQPPMVPPRRRGLSLADRQRLDGAQAAMRHLVARLDRARHQLVDHAVAPETPMVVNALLLGSAGAAGGVTRAEQVGFACKEGWYEAPEPEVCGELLHAAVAFATTAPAPALTRAGWLLAAIVAIQPFPAGNGRTSRLLFQGVHSQGLAGGFDWATAAEWAAHQRRYLDAIEAATAPSLPRYDPTRLEPQHLMELAATCSITGAQRAMARLHTLARVVDGLCEEAASEPLAVVEAFIATERNVTLDELGELGLDQVTATTAVEALVEAGRIDWSRGGRLAHTGDHPFAELPG